MSNFILYTKPNCVQCNMTKKKMSDLGIVPEVRDATVNIDEIVDMGYTSVPVVISPSGEHWSGYQPDMLVKHSEPVLS